MMTIAITPLVELTRTLDRSVGHGFAVAAIDSFVESHNVSDPQCLTTMLDGQL